MACGGPSPRRPLPCPRPRRPPGFLPPHLQSSPDLPTAVLSAAGETDQPDDGVLPERRQPGAPALSVLPLDLLRAPHVVRPGGGRRAPAGCRDAGERGFSRRLDLASVRGPRRGAAGGRVVAPCAPGMRDGGGLSRRR